MHGSEQSLCARSRNDSTTQKPPALGETDAAWYGKGTTGKRQSGSSGEGRAISQCSFSVSVDAFKAGSSEGCSISFDGAPLEMSSDRLYSMFEECSSWDAPLFADGDDGFACHQECGKIKSFWLFRQPARVSYTF